MTAREGSASPFVEALERLLAARGMSWRQLSKQVHYSPGWLSKVKNGKPPSAELARLCDQVLEANGELIALASAESSLRPAQLPAATARFVGRRSQREVARRALDHQPAPGAPAVLAINGPPGAGKTALALRLAHDVVGRFPDGQLYVDLHGHSSGASPARPDNVLEEFLTALGVSVDTIPAGPEQRAKLYRSVLARQRVLVVLDNAASSDQIAPLLPSSSGCGVIVTSRPHLPGLRMATTAVDLPLGPMTPDDAVTLLRTVIGADQRSAELDSIPALADHCGHLPLALRIAAERLATHPHLRVDDLVEELADQGRRLDGLEADDESVAVRTVFSSSYRDLRPEVARLFRLLGLHQGPHLSVAAATALAGTAAERDGRRQLERLASVHLVEGVARDRYRFHDLLRVYAAERAEAEAGAERDAAVGRLAEWYLHTANDANHMVAPFRIKPLDLPPPTFELPTVPMADRVSALRWCDAEVDNFVPVMRMALAHRLFDTAWRFAVTLFDYFLVRKCGRAWVATHELAVRAARELDDRRAEGWVINNLAEAYRWQGRFGRSRELFERALEIRRDVGDRHGQAWSLTGAASMAAEHDEVDHAFAHARQALDIFTELGDVEGQVWSLASLGDIQRRAGRVAEAMAALEDAYRASEQIDDPYGPAWTLSKIAEAHLALGAPDRALAFLGRALESCQRSGERVGEAEVLARQAAVLDGLGRDADARRSWSAAARLFEEIDDPRAAEVRARLQSS